MMRMSIIVLVYNVEQYLQRCVDMIISSCSTSSFPRMVLRDLWLVIKRGHICCQLRF